MFRAVFFDLDDTLVDAMDCHLEANDKTFAKFGISYLEIEEKTKDHDFLGKRMNEILLDMRNVVGVSEEKLPLSRLTQVREDIFLKIVDEKAKLFPGAKKAISKAREGFEIVAVVSSGTRKYIRVALEKFNLSKYVDFIVGEEDVERGKPFPDCYEKAFAMLPKKLKIKKNGCLVVEDSINGVKAAKAAGMKVLWVPSKYSKGETETDWKLKSLEEFDLTAFNN